MWTREDVQGYRDLSPDLAVGRLGRDWRVLDKTTERGRLSVLGPPFQTRTEAREHAEERRDRGDYR